MTTPELLAIIFISALFLVALSAILMKERDEHGIFKIWKW
jgi:hypothetical protein